MNGRIICIWGNSASGKTITSLALAAKLAKKKKNIILFSGDKLVPALKIYAPTQSISSKQSIGPMIMSKKIDDLTLASKMVCHSQCEFISFVGMAPGDTYISYAGFERESVIKLANKMAFLADYVIIDGTANPLDDMMTLTMLELADMVIRITTPDNKGIVYTDANKVVYQDEKYHYDEQIKILGNIRDVSPMTEVMTVSGHFDYTLPYSHEVESKFIAGELICDMKRRKGIEFEKTIDKLAERILGL